MNDKTESTFNEWALVELFGHQRIAGKVTEATLAGGTFIRVDVPAFDGHPPFTRFFSPGAIYSINPVTEDIARQLIAGNRHEPVSRFELTACNTDQSESDSGEVDKYEDDEDSYDDAYHKEF